MFSLMACCFDWYKERRKPRKQVTLVLIGLDNAGKTTALKGVQGESFDLVAPTVGFASGEFKFEKYDVTVYDLGGGKGIRGIWSNYYAEAHGVVFVIDASDEERLQECKECLEQTLKKERIQGKRILLLANKQDQEGALDEIDICDQLDLEEIVNRSKCPCRVETCSANQGIGKKIDPSIQDGMKWLLDGIAADWENITKRVDEDVAAQKEEEARLREEKRERIRQIREAREKKEEEERKAAGIEEKVESDDEDVMAGGNPFAKVDDEYFDKKKQEQKAEKEKEKKKKAASASKDSNNKNNNEMREIHKDSESEEPVQTNVKETAMIHANGQARKEESRTDELSNGGNSERTQNDNESNQLVVGSQENLIDGEPSQVNGAGEETKKKKKKKKIKKNKTAPAPLPVDGVDEVMPPPLPTPIGTPSWAQAPGHRSLFMPSHKPTLAPLVEKESPRQNLDPLVPSSTANHKRKALPELKPISSLKPNIEDDEDVMT